MALPEIGGDKEGIPRMFYIHTGAKWIAVLGDASGHPQIDIVSSALPTDAATEATLDAIKTAVESKDAVPSSIINKISARTACADLAETTVLTYTVTEGATLYITDWGAHDDGGPPGPEFQGMINIAGADVWPARAAAGSSLSFHFTTPLVATSEQAVTISIYQATGGAKNFYAFLSGFEV